ncbi:MAG: sugar phosphate nucleotidyltransferase [Ilumatobacteraceae bacterium]|nr:MAG: NTP transferase domain-containing protein [Actinomycetota bacterium]
MKAVIMAGGEGTRLRPLTSNAPKPMLPIANRPMMEHVVDLLRQHGFDEIVVTVAFLASNIKTYFGDGSEFGVSMKYAHEAIPLGTAGSVANARELLDERFLVISGDVVTDIDLTAILALHEEKGAMATIGLTPVDNPLEFGIVITREDGTIERFLEKPTWGQVFSDTINTGIYVLEPEVFRYIPEGRSVDFSGEVFPQLLADGQPLYGAVAEGYWEDVGTLDAYLRSHKDVLDQRVRLRIPGFEISDGVWVGEGTEISPEATVVGPAVIGPGCRVEAGCSIGEYTVLGSNVRLTREVQIERSVIHDHVYLGDSTRLRGAVVGRNSSVRSGSRIEEGAVLGDEVFVGSDALIAGDVKVYPFKTIEDGAVVNTSIVWESRGARSLFGRDGVNGLANVDVTPELATKVAMAFGTSLGKGSTVVTSRDSSRSARMLKRAMMAGLNGTGVDVLDLEMASIPVTRFLVRSPRAYSGLTVRLHPDDAERVIIRFFDSNGSDISEDAQRKIERLFQREDFRRALPEDIGDINFPARALEEYTFSLENTVEKAAIMEHRFKLVVDYSFGTTSVLMPTLLGKLNADVLAVNPFASTAGRLQRDPVVAVERVAGLVRASGAHLGVVLDPDGERLTVVDDLGRILTHTEALLAFVSMVCDHLLGDSIALPVNITMRAAELANAKGVNIRQTKLSTPALMAAATDPAVGFASDGAGGYILPGFLPAFDAAAALLKLLDLLGRSAVRLSEVVDNLPKVHQAHETIVTPWEQKGLVMRSLVEMAGRNVELVDGVKMSYPEGWVLALPDPEEPVTHVWSEAGSDAEARRLGQEYARRIRQLVR